MTEKIKEIEFTIKVIGSKNKDYTYCFFLFNQKVYVIPFAYSKSKTHLIANLSKAKVGVRPYKSFTKLEDFLKDIPLDKRIEHIIDFKFSFFKPLKKRDSLKFLNDDEELFWRMVHQINKEVSSLDGIL